MASDRKRMFELGGWLERYLNPDIKAREYRKLAQEFIKQYRVDFKVKETDLSLKVAGFIDSATPEKQQKIISSMNAINTGKDYDVKIGMNHKTYKGFYNSIFEAQTAEGKEVLELITERLNGLIGLEIRGRTVSYDDSGIIEWIIHAQEQVARLFQVKFLTKYTLEKLLQRDEKWNIVLADEEFYYFKGSPFNYPNDGVGIDPYFFLNAYEGVVDRLGKFDNEVKLTSVFTEKYIWSIYEDGNFDNIFPWMVAVSRVVFDFLMMGGQDQSLFCKHCGRFTVVKRKGKEYCSDVCRTAQGRIKRTI